MHLFSTHGCHIVHWDPGIAIVFPEFLSTSIYSCGTVGFGVFILFWFLSPGFSLCPFCIEAALVFLIFMIRIQSSLSRVDPACAKHHRHDSSAWAAMRRLADFLWAPVLFMREKRSLSEMFHQAQCGSAYGKSHSHKHLDNLVLKFFVFFYPPPSTCTALHHKVSVTPDPTYPGSSSCKSLLASHCAVPQSNVSSNDCAINTSEWLLPLCSINMRTFV